MCTLNSSPELFYSGTGKSFGAHIYWNHQCTDTCRHLSPAQPVLLQEYLWFCGLRGLIWKTAIRLRVGTGDWESSPRLARAAASCSGRKKSGGCDFGAVISVKTSPLCGSRGSRGQGGAARLPCARREELLCGPRRQRAVSSAVLGPGCPPHSAYSLSPTVWTTRPPTHRPTR